MKTCPKCQSKFPLSLIIDGKRRNLSKRIFCLQCSPFGNHNTQNLLSPNSTFEKNGKKFKKCPSCEKVLELNNTNYYIKSNNKTFHYYCKFCNDEKSLKNKLFIKQKSVEYKGGKCQLCGYNKCIGALEFHHIDPSKKDFLISKYSTYNFDKIKIELDKCMLLCANCHRETHEKINS